MIYAIIIVEEDSFVVQTGRNKGIYFAAIGGAGALLSKAIAAWHLPHLQNIQIFANAALSIKSRSFTRSLSENIKIIIS